jgi:hypothetical protein
VAYCAFWVWNRSPVQDQIQIWQCRFQSVYGECITERDYIRLQARDAAQDALADKARYCNSPYSALDDPVCKAFHGGH